MWYLASVQMELCNLLCIRPSIVITPLQLAEFNRVIIKKDISPLKKWAIVEGLPTYFFMGDHMTWMSKF